MSSGKTDELLRLLRRAEIARRRIVLVRPDVDDRTPAEYAESRSKARYPSTPVPKSEPVRILALARERDVDLVGIEESQFFDQSLVQAVETLRQSGRHVIACGLNTDFAWSSVRPDAPAARHGGRDHHADGHLRRLRRDRHAHAAARGRPPRPRSTTRSS